MKILFHAQLFIGVFSCMITCTVPFVVYAQDTSGENEKATATDNQSTGYEYILEGRHDPFKPFLSPRASTDTSLDPNEILDEDKVLSGMQLFEPGQLTLVAVLGSNKSKMAMVEDVSGKGYIIKEGNLIGRRGVITQIEKQQIVITETARTRAGKEIDSTVIMRMKKEGDE